MESRFNADKVEAQLASPDAWNGRYQTASDIDEFKVPECVDDFLILMQLMTDRYRLLTSQKEAMHRFLTLQTQLLDDFRMRLLQVGRHVPSVWDEQYCQILNGIAYILYVLKEWNDLPFFVQLHSAQFSVKFGAEKKRRFSSAKNETEFEFESTLAVTSSAFDSAIDMFQHLQYRMLEVLINDAMLPELKQLLVEYQKEKFYVTTLKPVSISATFCPFLMRLRSRLNDLQVTMSSATFRKFLSALCSKLNELVCIQILSEVNCNEMGALQIEYDMKNGLFSLLASYDQNILGMFSQVEEILNVLCLQLGNALLLKDALSSGNYEEIFTEFGIYNLSLDRVQHLLSARVDVIQMKTKPN